MSKWIYFSLLLAVVISSCGKADNKDQSLEDDQARIESQLKAAEEAEAAKALVDSMRQDSIQKELNRQDSIAQEEKMRLKPSVFQDGWWNEKALKRLGFKKIKEKDTPYEEDDGLSLYEVTYTRTFNGRRIDLEGSAESCHGVDIIFHDNGDKNLFIQELRKIGAKKDSGFVQKYYFEYNIKGNKIEISGCG